MTDKFFQPGKAKELYEKYRDDTHPEFEKRRNYIEWMYSLFAPYADSNFRKAAMVDFWERLWEMHLGVTVLEAGYHLGATKDSDLDLKVQLHNGSTLWIEASLPQKGTGPDAAPTRTEYQGNIDDYIDPIIPRVTQRLNSKRDQIKKKGLETPVVIAINSAEIDSLAGATDRHIIEGVLFGRGNLQVTRDRKWSYAAKNPVKKKNNSPIPVGLFLEPSFNCISAVLYRNRHPAITPVDWDKDILVVHNPNADHPLPPEQLKIGQHITWKIDDGGKFELNDFRKNT